MKNEDDGGMSILKISFHTGRLWEGEERFAQAEEETKQPVGADQEEGERQRQRNDRQGQRCFEGAEKGGKQWRKDR